MATDEQTQRTHLDKGYPPQRDRTQQRGYQPQSAQPLDPKKLKPPKSDTAIQPPQKPASKE